MHGQRRGQKPGSICENQVASGPRPQAATIALPGIAVAAAAAAPERQPGALPPKPVLHECQPLIHALLHPVHLLPHSLQLLPKLLPRQATVSADIEGENLVCRAAVRRQKPEQNPRFLQAAAAVIRPPGLGIWPQSQPGRQARQQASNNYQARPRPSVCSPFPWTGVVRAAHVSPAFLPPPSPSSPCPLCSCG